MNTFTIGSMSAHGVGGGRNRAKILWSAVLAAGIAGAVTGCGVSSNTAVPQSTSPSGTSIAASVHVAIPPTSTTTVPTLGTVPSTSASPAAAAGSTGLMPYVVCMNLQDAQDAIHGVGVFFSRSKDATGAGRRQIIDRNWTVVAQSPAPGTPITEGDAVLSVVKNGEPNSCH